MLRSLLPQRLLRRFFGKHNFAMEMLIDSVDEEKVQETQIQTSFLLSFLL